MRHLSPKDTLLTLLAVSTLGSCGVEPGEDELRTQEHPVLGGTPLTYVPWNQPHKIDLAGCSGSALSNNWVLTAGHCLNTFMDHTFTSDGKTYATNLTPQNEVVYGVGVDSADRTVLAISDVSGKMLVKRLQPNGLADTTFNNTTGTLVYANLNATPSDLVIDDSDNIYISGTTTYQGKRRMTVWKVKPNGQLDTSFSGDGVRIPVFNSAIAETGASIDLDSQGRIVLGGHIEKSNGSTEYAIVRLKPNSALDTSFDSDGKVLVPFASSSSNSAEEVGVDPYDNTIYLLGTSQTSSGNRAALMRLNENGSLHTQFDYDGKAYLDFDADTAKAGGLFVDASSGNVLVGGTASEGGKSYFGLTMVRWSQTPSTSLGTVYTKQYPHTSKMTSATLTDIARSGPGTNTFQNNVILVGFSTHEGKQKYTSARILPNTGVAVTVRGAELRTRDFASSVASYAYKGVQRSDGFFSLAGFSIRSNGVTQLDASVTRHRANPFTTDYAGTTYNARHGNTGTQVAAAQAFVHPDLDVGLLQMSSPLSIFGSTTGYIESLYQGNTSDLVGETVTCYGYGAFSSNGASLQMTVDASLSGGDKYRVKAITSGTGLCRGDSGGACYDSNGDLTGVQSSAALTQGSTTQGNQCGSTNHTQISSEGFRGWVTNTLLANP